MPEYGNGKGGRQGGKPYRNENRGSQGSYRSGTRKPTGEGRPAYGRPTGEGRPAYGRPTGEGRPAYGKPTGEGRPTYGRPTGEGRPAYGKPTGDKRPAYGKPIGEGRAAYGRQVYKGRRPADRDAVPGSFGDKRPAFASSRPAPMPAPRMDGRPAPMPAPRMSGRPAPMPRPRFDRRSPRPDFAPPAAPPKQYVGDAEPENLLVGRNPIREAIRAGHAIERLLVARGLTGSAVEIIAKARDAGIVVQEVERIRLDGIYPNHQGMIAYASAAEYIEFDNLMQIPAERGEEPFFVALDGVTDPHNLGAILRSAACAGAHGVIVPERRAAGLVPAAVKATAGALEHIGVAKVGNLRAALEKMKERGIWVTGAAAEGEDVDTCDLSGPVCLVIGSEGDGIGQLIRSTCDRLVSIPMANGMESLNASVAAGILLYDIRRARGGK